MKDIKQVARADTDEGEFMTLTLIAALQVGHEGDTIKITGMPDLEIKLKGTNGDIATVAIAVNAIRRVREAASGLVTMRELPIVTNCKPSVLNHKPDHFQEYIIPFSLT